jgi:hypothetical protein
MDEMLKEFGKGAISLANMLLVIFFLNHIFLENIETSIGSVAVMLYIFTGLYLVGGLLIKKGRDKEKNR